MADISIIFSVLLYGLPILLIIIITILCICWRGQRTKKQLYIMDSDVASNTDPHVINDTKQKYFLHDVKYSSISESTDHFSYNILSIFRNIQRNKFAQNDIPKNKKTAEDLEDSQIDVMHKNFDKSVLSLQWNEATENNPPTREKDDTYSCISSDSKGTFTSVVPFYNRSQSVAETFKSINSEN